MMLVSPFIQAISALSNQWAFVLILPSILVLVNGSKTIRAYTSAMWFPTLLLLIRKVALFVPISGALSTADRVVFFSFEAILFYTLALAVHIALVCAVNYIVVNARRRSSFDPESNGVALLYGLFWAYLGLWIASVELLPVRGWCHLYMPLLGMIGALKLLVVSPFLLPLAWFGLCVQSGIALFAHGVSGREINKLLTLGILVGGLLDLGFQPINLAQSPALKAIHAPGTKDFLGVWARKLQSTDHTGFQIVETDLPTHIRRDHALLMENAPFPWIVLGSSRAMLSLLIGFLLLIVAERLPLRNERMKERESDYETLG